MPHIAGHVLGLTPDENPTQGGPTGAATTPVTKASQDAAINAVIRDLATYAITAKEANDALLALGVDQARAAALLRSTVIQRGQQNKPGEPTGEGAGPTGTAAPEGTTTAPTAAPTAAQDGTGATPTGQSAFQGGGVGPFGDFSSREEALLDLEGDFSGLRSVFGGFLGREPFGALSALGRRGAERQGDLALAQFLTNPASQRQGNPLTFRDFLGGSTGQNVSAQTVFSQLANIGQLFNQPASGFAPDDPNLRLRDAFESSPFAFAQALPAALAGIHPFFRDVASRTAQRLFDRSRTQQPETPFVQQLARRGGNIFGAFV